LIIQKKKTTSNGSRKVYLINKIINYKFLVNKLRFGLKNNAGRNTAGQIIVRTKGSLQSKKNLNIVNYSIRT
jgi:ribosomal protein L2